MTFNWSGWWKCNHCPDDTLNEGHFWFPRSGRHWRCGKQGVKVT